MFSGTSLVALSAFGLLCLNKRFKVNTIQKGNGLFLCQVTVFFKDRGYGFVVCNGDKAYIHMAQSKKIIAGVSHPEFATTGTEAQAPKQGDIIIAKVEETKGEGHSCKWHATVWGLESELSDAKWVIDSREPKPAPVAPPMPHHRVVQNKAPQSKIDRRRPLVAVT